LSLGQIVDLLNRRGLKAARGGRWHKASVAGVLCGIEAAMAGNAAPGPPPPQPA
jgi:hypothetical protein